MTIIVGPVSSGCQLSVLLTELQARGYGSDTRDEQVILFNAIQRRIAGLRRWPWLESGIFVAIPTVVGQHSYSLAAIADYQHIDAVRMAIGTEYYELDHMPPQEYRTNEHRYRDNGTPRFWTKHEEQIKIWPRPDRIYTLNVDYVKKPTDMTADSDLPAIPCAYRDIYTWGAIMELTFRERDWDGHGFAERNYNGRLTEMMNEYGLRQRQTASEVKRSGYLDANTEIVSYY